MADDNEATAAAKAALEQKDAEIGELNKKLNDLTSQRDAKEEMIQRQGNERGEDSKAIRESSELIRKASLERDELNKALREAQELLGQAQGELAELKQQGPVAEAERKTQAEALQQEIAVLQSKLSDKDKAELEAAIQAAGPEMQKKVEQDDETYRNFLLEFKKSKGEGSPAPRRRWDTPAQDANTPPDADGLAALFKKTKESAEYNPDGPDGGIPRGGSQHKRPPTGYRKADWVGTG